MFEKKTNDKEINNFRSYFNKKYEAMFTDITIPFSLYSKLKDFYNKNNFDSNIKTFNKKNYDKYNFSYLRIITMYDLLYMNENEKLKVENIENLTKNDKLKIYREELKKLNLTEEQFFYEPVNWRTFISFMQNLFNGQSSKNKQDLENFSENKLDMLREEIKNKKLNFQHYQRLYKNAKTCIILNSIKKLLFPSDDIEPNIIKQI